MKKILIVNDGFPPHSWGGANTIALLHAKGLVAAGYNVRVLTTTQEKAKAGDYEFEGLHVHACYTSYHYRWWAYKSLSNPEATAAFKKELGSFAPAIVHFHNIHQYFSYASITIAKKSGAKVFLTTHDVMSFAYQKLHHFIDYSSTSIPPTFNYHVPWWVNALDARKRFNPFRNLIIRKYLRQVDRIFAVSNALKQALSDNGIVGNVTVVHNGIDVATFEQPFDEPALRESLGLRGAKVLLFVGRFSLDKGRDVTIKALAEVIQSEPNAKLLVVGFDPKIQPDPSLERLIDELGVWENIVFVGSVMYSEIFKYYRIADCVVAPSIIFDSFPTVNLEAMAAGKPVVATCFGGSREVVIDNETGFIVNPIDTEAFAGNVIHVLRDPVLAQALGKRGKEHVVRQFSLAQQLAKYEQFY